MRGNAIAPCLRGAAPTPSIRPRQFGCGPVLCMLLACLGTLLGSCPAFAAPVPNTLLGTEELYQLTVRELVDRLTRSERFTALPANVAGVFCPETGTPIFFVGNEAQQEPPSDNPAIM